jgi:AraC-like DNA-binding protein
MRAELAARIDRLVGSVDRRETEVQELILVRRTRLERPACYTYEPSVALIAQGRKRVDLAAKSFIFGESQFLLTSVELPIVSQLVEASEERPYLGLLLKLDISVVRELLSLEGIAVTSTSRGLAMATGESSPELLGAFCRLLDLLDTPEDIGALSGLIQREIAYRLLRGPAGGRLRDIATLGDQDNRTAMAIAWIKRNYAKPLRVEDLARIAGMGLSTFHRRFRDLTAMSPLQYQKQLRLQNARASMLAGLDAAAAAFEVGYQSASQFSREYSRLFGQPPLQDVQALRIQT